MSSDIAAPGRRIPTLVQYCQRVACAHVENISCLGEGWQYDLIRPVLESCTADTLRRLEDADPYIASDTADIWKALFLRENPIAAHHYSTNAMEEPESWRDELFALRDLERERFAKLSDKLKAARQEEEERKQKSAIKLTDKLPPAKRFRGWGAPAQPKSLFQKTRSEASRLQKGVFGPPALRPPMRNKRLVSHTTSAKLPAPAPSKTPTSASCGSRVVVRSVVVTQKPPPAKHVPSTPAKAISTTTNPKGSAVSVLSPAAVSSPPRQSSPAEPSLPPHEIRSSPTNRPGKKDRAATLFMPKHRAYSQLPRGVQSKS